MLLKTKNLGWCLRDDVHNKFQEDIDMMVSQLMRKSGLNGEKYVIRLSK
jgi:hypothetical protein